VKIKSNSTIGHDRTMESNLLAAAAAAAAVVVSNRISPFLNILGSRTFDIYLV